MATMANTQNMHMHLRVHDEPRIRSGIGLHGSGRSKYWGHVSGPEARAQGSQMEHGFTDAPQEPDDRLLRHARPSGGLVRFWSDISVCGRSAWNVAVAMTSCSQEPRERTAAGPMFHAGFCGSARGVRRRARAHSADGGPLCTTAYGHPPGFMTGCALLWGAPAGASRLRA